MDLARISAEVEQDELWRTDELRFLSNHLAKMEDVSERDRFRRPMVLILYAHLEGFCKFCFSAYVDAVDRESLTCGQASFALAAAALSDVFSALRNSQRRSPIFSRALPDEAKLHRFARDREFLEQASQTTNRQLRLDADKVIDLESNLKPIVLQKTLFRLGLPHDLFSNLSNDLNRLLEYRNAIAHGRSSEGLDENTFRNLRDAALQIMHSVKHEILGALRREEYLRPDLG